MKRRAVLFEYFSQNGVSPAAGGAGRGRSEVVPLWDVPEYDEVKARFSEAFGRSDFKKLAD